MMITSNKEDREKHLSEDLTSIEGTCLEGTIKLYHNGKWFDTGVPCSSSRNPARELVLRQVDEIYASMPSLSGMPASLRRDKVRLLEDLLLMAGDMAFGYLFPDPNEETQESLDQIRAKLDVLSSSLAQIQLGIGQIFSRIDKLVSEIRGVIDQEIYRKHVQSCQSFIEWIQPKVISPRDLDANLTAIRVHLETFQDDINQILMRTQDTQGRDGVAGMVSVAQAMAIWAQVQNLILRADSSPQTVYDQRFHINKFRRFIKVFDRIDETKKALTDELQGTPHENCDSIVIPYKLQSGEFRRAYSMDPFRRMTFIERDYGSEPRLFGSYWKDSGGNHHTLEYAPIEEESVNWFDKPTLMESRYLWKTMGPRLKAIRFAKEYLTNSDDARTKIEALAAPHR